MQRAWAGRIVASRSCLWNGLTGMSHYHHVAVVRRLPCTIRSPMNKRGVGWLSTHAHQEPAVASGGPRGAQDGEESTTTTTNPGANDATRHAYRLLSSPFAHSKTLGHFFQFSLHLTISERQQWPMGIVAVPKFQTVGRSQQLVDRAGELSWDMNSCAQVAQISLLHGKKNCTRKSFQTSLLHAKNSKRPSLA